jgi:hypothetical protein
MDNTALESYSRRDFTSPFSNMLSPSLEHHCHRDWELYPTRARRHMSLISSTENQRPPSLFTLFFPLSWSWNVTYPEWEMGTCHCCHAMTSKFQPDNLERVYHTVYNLRAGDSSSK